MTATVRRNAIVLGEFTDAEIGRLLAKGRLLPTDEVRTFAGQWVALADHARSLNSPTSPDGRAVSNGPAPGGYFVHDRGRRLGPFDLMKLEAMLRSGLLDAAAMVEPGDGSGPVTSIGSLLASPIPPPLPPPYRAVSAVEASPAARNSDASFWSLWWRSTLGIFALMALLGYLNDQGRGLAFMMGAGIFLAPMKGAVLAGLIWAFRRK